MTYHHQLEHTTDQTAGQVLAALALYEAGDLTADALAAVVAAYVAAGNSAATAVADLSLAAVLTAELGALVAPLGILRPTSDPARLDQAARTILALPNATSPGRWERLARAEALTAAARAYSAGIARSPHVTGWVRGLDADPCQLCRWWHRDGRIWPADHPMPTHKGCGCHPIPVTTNAPISAVRHH